MSNRAPASSEAGSVVAKLFLEFIAVGEVWTGTIELLTLEGNERGRGTSGSPPIHDFILKDLENNLLP